MVLRGARAATGEDSLRGPVVRPWKLAPSASPTWYFPGAGHLRAALLACVTVAVPLSADAADRIILRNLQLIADRRVVAVDEDGALLDMPRAGGSDRLTWDEIERGRVASDLQADFDRFRTELGPPLYKLRLRLKIGDYAGLVEPAEALYEQFAKRRSQTAYLVCQSLMWGRLATGRREQAVEPFLLCMSLLASNAADAQRLPGTRRLAMEGLICSDLPPVWLERGLARQGLPALWESISGMPTPRPAEAYLYYASLASAAGEFAEAEKVLQAIPGGDAAHSAAVDLVRTQIDMQRNPAVAGHPAELSGDLSSATTALAHYWRGMRLLAADQRDQKRDGLLALLTIPAEAGERQPELAAAALQQAALGLAKLADETAARAVRRELTTRYSATAVGIQVSRTDFQAP